MTGAVPAPDLDDESRGDRPGDEPVLVVSDGWVLDDLAEARLRHQLRRADPTVAAIAAHANDLDPGDSCLNGAARRALEPLDALTPAADGPLQGAVLVRGGVVPEADDDGIARPDGGDVLVDLGAHVHDPWRAVEPLGPATEAVRPAFPRRPVVLFVGLEPDLDLADWTRALANNLIRRGVDARIALPETPEGLYLTRPCTPGPSVIDALAPQVVVPLDDEAREALDGWWGTNRSTLVIDHVPDMTLGVELVSWQLGRAEGRVRARIGAVVRAAELAPVIDRLCGGPQPIAPRDDEAGGAGTSPLEQGVAIAPARRARAEAEPGRSILILDGSPAGATDRHLDGLVDRLEASGHRIERRALDPTAPASLAEVDGALLHRVAATDEVLDALRRRRRDGRPTAVHLTPGDLESTADGRWRPRPPAARLIEVAGRAVAPSRTAADALADLSVRRLVVPLLLERTRVGELRRLRDGRGDPNEHLLGWRIDDDADPELVARVAAAVVRLLHDDPRLRLALVGRAEAVEWAADVEARVEPIAGPPDASTVNRWTTQLWTAGASTRLSGDLAPLLDASELGVPTIIDADHPARDLVPHPSPLVVRQVDEADAWYEQLHPVLTELGPRLRRSAEVARTVDALYGVTASALVVERFLGWMAEEATDG